MASPIKWQQSNSRDTGIANASLAAGANLVGAEIDNAANRDKFCSGDLVFNCATAPTANKVIEIHFLQSVNGSAYEDGGESIDPVGVPVACIPARAVTGVQRVALKNVLIGPFKFKPLLKSELDQNASGVTLQLFSHNSEV